ncbi:MAG: alpha-2-macroglobulin family protein, partial [Pseudomonadota bacterium]|nr:alpha-2-macroglobulin family protein [Pseudomonadota bacterium]
ADRAEVLPRQPLNVALDLGPLNPGEQAFALGWIIDDGVLRMTGYRDPDPLGHFLDPFDLPAELRDTFAALISSSGLEAAALEQGYDDALFAMRAMAPMAEMSLAMGLTTRIKETLALSTGVQALDAAGGGGSLSFDLPDFAGRGRLLTLVWTDQGRIGVGSQTLLIRDPVVADLFLPRFLAPGDEVDVRLLVSNTKDRALTAELSLELETGLDLVAGSTRLSLDLDAKGQQPVPLRLGATDVIGATKVVIDLTHGEQTIRREFPIEVRPAAPRTLVRDSFLLSPGETLSLDASQLAALNHASLGLSVSGLGVDPLPLAQSLADYPFRCTEQTTSRAIGLLLGGDRLMARPTLDFALNEALVTLQNRQGLDGIIGLWPGSASGDLFLQAYAADFLALAKAEGIDGAAALHEAFVARLARGLEQAEDPYFE